MAKKKRKEELYIPAEMVEEILLHLPVKSLLRFSSVSKASNSMITDSRFIKTYRGRERILLPYRTSPELSSMSISSSSSETELESLVYPSCMHPRDLLTTCNELVLVSADKSLFIWNPSMRKHKRIHYPSIVPYGSDHLYAEFCYGLGYDSVADDYKILKLESKSSPSIELYSLTSDSWRDISNLFTGLNLNLNSETVAVFVCGNLHWTSYNHHNDNTRIISFDLSTEKVGEVALPNYFPTESQEKVSVLRGMLCLTLHYYDKNYNVDVWLMEDYGVVTSWTKRFSIQSLDTCVVPLYFYENGDVLARSGNWEYKIRVYKDDKTAPRRIHCPYFDYTFMYIDGFVAPWSDDEELANRIPSNKIKDRS